MASSAYKCATTIFATNLSNPRKIDVLYTEILWLVSLGPSVSLTLQHYQWSFKFQICMLTCAISLLQISLPGAAYRLGCR